MKSPAQEAHDLALERIVAAKESGEQALCLSPREFNFGGKPYPGDERFEHLTALPLEITGLTALQSLNVSVTQVADITPLAGLTALQKIELHDTQFADISPLAGLTALQTIALGGT